MSYRGHAIDDNVYDLNAILHPGSVTTTRATSWRTMNLRSPRKDRSWRHGLRTPPLSPRALR
jgi:hypothetical protein